MSAYLLVSLPAHYFRLETIQVERKPTVGIGLVNRTITQFSRHSWWESGTTWKSALNNLRLIIQPYLFYCLIKPWLKIYNLPGFRRGFLKLIDLMNKFRDFSIIGSLTIPFNFPLAC
jgi:hypothetical protein